ncbi:MAG: hypothetical protein KDD94_03305 [Calditrichaeota bacterium]|nr:hypothetical protein [Calditrichota bacterium]
MLKKIWFDLLLLLKNQDYKISENLHNDLLEYPFIFDEKEISAGKKQRLINEFDQDGIPLNKSYIDVEGGKNHYYPITIGQLGIAVHRTYMRTKSETDKNRFLKFADWFMQHKKSHDNYCYWLTDVAKPEYQIFRPWKSAFSQSRAISILLRAYDITNERIYLDTIDSALNLFYIPYDQDGIMVQTKSGFFYEEYPANEPTMVLDGHMFILFAFIELIKQEKKLPEHINKKTQDLFQKGIEALRETLPDFDLGFWLRFNLCKMKGYPEIDPCTIGYFRLIINQLRCITRFEEDHKLTNYYLSFLDYYKLSNIFKAYWLKYKTLRTLKRV